MHSNRLNRRRFLAATAGGTLATIALEGLRNMSLARTGTVASPALSLRTGYVYDDLFLAHVLTPSHVESPERLRTVEAYLTQTGLSERVAAVKHIVDPVEPILAVHSQAHHDSVQWCSPAGRVAAVAVAQILGAVTSVHNGEIRNAFCAIRPPGHHSFNNGGGYDGTCMGQGFCFYGNVAIAAKYLREVLGYERVLICDWDYHYGNGTAWAFDKDPSVFFFSTHNWNAYPGSGDPGYTGSGAGEGYTLNVHLGSGARDRDIVRAWDEDLARALSARDFKPDFVLISAGFDSRMDDTLGTFSITDGGFAALTQRAMAIADEHCGGRLISCLEGGYNVDGLGRAVCAHVATLAGLDWREFVPNRAKSQAFRKPLARGFEVREGLLIIPDDKVGKLERVVVVDTTGREVYCPPKAELRKRVIDIWPKRLAGGSYIAVVHLHDGVRVETPFQRM